MRITLLIALLSALVVGAPGQVRENGDDISLKVSKLLLNKDLEVLAGEMAANKARDVESILMRLDVFARAGDKTRVNETLRLLSEAPDFPADEKRKDWILKFVRKYVANDLTASRIYYEHLTADDGYYETSRFIRLWETNGEAKALEHWLSKRAVRGTSWYMIDLERRLKRDEAQPILDSLAANVRSDPADTQALSEYLAIVSHAQQYTSRSHPRRYDNETDWLENVLRAEGAVDAYQTGEKLASVNPLLAIKYFLKSLAAPIGSGDIAALKDRYSVQSSIGSPRAINWEKQLRYWTKEKLASAYQKTGQSVLAQPLVEELVALKGDDIFEGQISSLAGAVQSGSGARVIESKVIQDETERSRSIQYWQERIDYYIGRNEGAAVVGSFGTALAKLPPEAKPWFISWFGNVFGYHLNSLENAAELRKHLGDILLEQFNSAKLDSELAYEAVWAATPEGLGVESVMRDLFVRRRDVFGPVVASIKNHSRSDLIRYVLRLEGQTLERREYYLNQLERIAANEGAESLFQMADVFEYLEEYERSISLLQKYLRKVSSNSGPDSGRATALIDLFIAYNQAGKWQSAEKLMNDNQSVFLGNWGGYLQRLAIAAGRANSPDEAFRIWRRSLNFNVNSDFALNNLADTTTKPLIIAYYQKLKRDEPNSLEAERALKILIPRSN